MKKLKIVIATLIMAICITGDAFAGVQHIVGNGGSLDWNGDSGINCDCKKGGTDCYMIIGYRNIVVVDGGNNNWVITGNITDITANVTPVNASAFSAPVIFTNWTFPESAFVITADTFPDIPALSFQMDGVVTDSNGDFTLSIPK